MQYRIDQLAAASGVRAETIRFYQGKKLLPGPRRVGRIAVYDDAHLERIARIRELLDQGLTLALIKRVLDGETEARGGATPLLLASLARV